MPYVGWLEYGGVEIANERRVFSYARGGLGPRALDCGCDTVEAALGLDDVAYTSPAGDLAPWFDARRPESGLFGGVLVESVRGLDVPVSGRQVTDGARGRATLGRLRDKYKTIDIEGVLFGHNEIAIDYGANWLNDVLSGHTCSADPCDLGALEFFTGCPPAGDLAPAVLGELPVEVCYDTAGWAWPARITSADETATQRAVPHAVPAVLNFDGTFSSGVQARQSADLLAATDSLCVVVAFHDWGNQLSYARIADHGWEANYRRWILYKRGTDLSLPGLLDLAISDDGNTIHTSSWGTTASYVGAGTWVKVTAVADGTDTVVTWWTSDDRGATWTQREQDTLSGCSQIYASPGPRSPLTVGCDENGNTAYDGEIEFVRVYDADPDDADTPGSLMAECVADGHSGLRRWSDPLGHEWTVLESGYVRALVDVPEPVLDGAVGWQVHADGYVDLAGGRWATPASDATALLTSWDDITVVVELLEDPEPSAFSQQLVTMDPASSGSNRGWALYLEGSNTRRWNFMWAYATSSVLAHSYDYDDGDWVAGDWLKVESLLVGTTRTTTWYRSRDAGRTWVQMGQSTTTSANTVIYPTTADLTIGAREDGTLPYSGRIGQVRVFAGDEATGRRVAWFDPRGHSSVDTSFRSQHTGELWALTGAASIEGTAALLTGEGCPGSDDLVRYPLPTFTGQVSIENVTRDGCDVCQRSTSHTTWSSLPNLGSMSWTDYDTGEGASGTISGALQSAQYPYRLKFSGSDVPDGGIVQVSFSVTAGNGYFAVGVYNFGTGSWKEIIGGSSSGPGGTESLTENLYYLQVSLGSGGTGAYSFDVDWDGDELGDCELVFWGINEYNSGGNVAEQLAGFELNYDREDPDTVGVLYGNGPLGLAGTCESGWEIAGVNVMTDECVDNPSDPAGGVCPAWTDAEDLAAWLTANDPYQATWAVSGAYVQASVDAGLGETYGPLSGCTWYGTPTVEAGGAGGCPPWYSPSDVAAWLNANDPLGSSWRVNDEGDGVCAWMAPETAEQYGPLVASFQQPGVARYTHPGALGFASTVPTAECVDYMATHGNTWSIVAAFDLEQHARSTSIIGSNWTSGQRMFLLYVDVNGIPHLQLSGDGATQAGSVVGSVDLDFNPEPPTGVMWVKVTVAPFGGQWRAYWYTSRTGPEDFGYPVEVDTIALAGDLFRPSAADLAGDYPWFVANEGDAQVLYAGIFPGDDLGGEPLLEYAPGFSGVSIPRARLWGEFDGTRAAWFETEDNAEDIPALAGITDYLDIRVSVKMNAAPDPFGALFGVWEAGANERAWLLQLNASRQMLLQISPDGTSAASVTSTAVPLAALQAGCILRVTKSGTAVNFYYSTDGGVTWTATGSGTHTYSAVYASSASPLVLGGNLFSLALTNRFDGLVQWAEVRNSNGDRLARCDLADMVDRDALEWDSATTGERWERRGHARVVGGNWSAIHPPNYQTTQYVQATYTGSHNVTGDIDMAVRLWVPPTGVNDGYQTVWGRRSNEGSGSVAPFMRLAGVASLRRIEVYQYSGGWSTLATDNGVLDDLPSGEVWLRARIDKDNGSSQTQIDFYYSAEDVDDPRDVQEWVNVGTKTSAVWANVSVTTPWGTQTTSTGEDDGLLSFISGWGFSGDLTAGGTLAVRCAPGDADRHVRSSWTDVLLGHTCTVVESGAYRVRLVSQNAGISNNTISWVARSGEVWRLAAATTVAERPPARRIMRGVRLSGSGASTPDTAAIGTALATDITIVVHFPEWIDDITGYPDSMVIAEQWDTGSNRRTFQLFRDVSTNLLQLGLTSDGTAGTVAYSAFNATADWMRAGKWVKVESTVSGTRTTRWYVSDDGQSWVLAETDSGGPTTLHDSNAAVFIGQRRTDSGWLVGGIGQVRIYGGAETPFSELLFFDPMDYVPGAATWVATGGSQETWTPGIYFTAGTPPDGVDQVAEIGQSSYPETVDLAAEADRFHRTLPRVGLTFGVALLGEYRRRGVMKARRFRATLTSEGPHLYGPLAWSYEQQALDGGSLVPWSEANPTAACGLGFVPDCVTVTSPAASVAGGECFTAPSSTSMQVLTIEADTVGGIGPGASGEPIDPVLVVGVGSSTLRNLRLKVYERRFGDTQTAPTPGGTWDAEHWECDRLLSTIDVPQLPAGATLSIDTRSNLATLVLADGEQLAGERFISGADGAPLGWPEPTACADLLVVVMADPDNTAADATISAGAAERYALAG